MEVKNQNRGFVFNDLLIGSFTSSLKTVTKKNIKYGVVAMVNSMCEISAPFKKVF